MLIQEKEEREREREIGCVCVGVRKRGIREREGENFKQMINDRFFMKRAEIVGKELTVYTYSHIFL